MDHDDISPFERQVGRIEPRLLPSEIPTSDALDYLGSCGPPAVREVTNAERDRGGFTGPWKGR